MKPKPLVVIAETLQIEPAGIPVRSPALSHTPPPRLVADRARIGGLPLAVGLGASVPFQKGTPVIQETQPDAVPQEPRRAVSPLCGSQSRGGED